MKRENCSAPAGRFTSPVGRPENRRQTPGFQTTPARSLLMGRVRQSDTPAELTVRSLLHACGFRFRTRAGDLPGTPDIVNRKAHWAIFVHGCFWHAHEGCARWRIPKTNHATWLEKFQKNRERDRRAIQMLHELDYQVLVIWECELDDEQKLLVKLLSFLEPAYSRGDGERHRLIKDRSQITRTVLSGDEAWSTVYPLTLEAPEEDAQSAFDRQFLTSDRWPSPTTEVNSPVRVSDLFCGCGGLSLGAREACSALGRSFQPVLAIDNDERALRVYRQNFTPLYSPAQRIETILDGALGAPPTASERSWRHKLGDIGLVLAGPPCQGHSDLNNQTRRTDPRNRLYDRVGRFAEVYRPEHLLIENVPSVVRGRDGALNATVDLLERAGYMVDSGVVDLLELGVPQRRKRHIVVASLSKALVIAEVVEKYRVPERGVLWAIGDLRDAVGKGPFERASQCTQENLRRIHHLFNNDLYDLPNALRPSCHKNGGHTYKSMYGRLRWTEPAQTITSGFGSPGQGRYIHPSKPRTLTPHEAARLQFFPDSFSFAGIRHRTALATMIGNAVPMRLSYVFCLEFLLPS